MLLPRKKKTKKKGTQRRKPARSRDESGPVQLEEENNKRNGSMGKFAHVSWGMLGGDGESDRRKAIGQTEVASAGKKKRKRGDKMSK